MQEWEEQEENELIK